MKVITRTRERQPNERSLEAMAYDCFLAHLSNPEVRKGQVDLQVIAVRSFEAALAFREVAANRRKERQHANGP